MKSFHRRTSRATTRPPHLAPTAAAAHPGSMRADQLLVERGLAPSRTVAQRLIEAGRVTGPDGPVVKASALFAATEDLALLPDANDRFDSYVGRGGHKLAGALAHTGLDANGVRGRICLDVGQSTGGFTDCLFQAGAKQVVGVDVGHGQLHPTLAADPRVEAHEGINARELQKSALVTRHNGRFDLIVADVSFISLTLILPQLPALLAPHGDMLLLVKPQFEVGPQNVGKGGIVRDPALYAQVEAKLRHCCAEHHLRVLDWFDSPITGSDGNREFFMHLQNE